MAESATYRLEQFIADLTRVSFTDILVHVPDDAKAVYPLGQLDETTQILPLDLRLNQLLKLAQQHLRLADLQPLCVAKELFCWNYREQLIQTPFILIPARLQFRKTSSDFKLEFFPDQSFINPFLISTIEHEYGIQLMQDEEHKITRELLLDQLSEYGLHFELKGFNGLGNFHHHRYEILRDLEEIASLDNASYLVKKILGSANVAAYEFDLPLSQWNFFPSDPDQQQVFDLVQHQDLVIQGPPGTGKSQVLGNLLIKLLASDQKHLVVSEKKTALEVLRKRLYDAGLGDLCCVLHTGTQSGDFVQQIKTTWEKFEQHQAIEEPFLNRSKHVVDSIQMVLDKLRLSEETRFFPLSFYHDFQQSEAYDQLPFRSDVPDMKTWLAWKNKLEEAVVEGLSVQVAACIKQVALIHVSKLDEALDELLKEWKAFEAKGIHTLSDLEKQLKAISRIQLLENERGKSYLELVHAPRKKQKFDRIGQRWRQLSEQLALFEQELAQWKNLPAKSALKALIGDLENGSWLSKRKARNYLGEQLKVKHPDPKAAAQSLLDFYHKQEEELNLRHELEQYGIYDPAHEINMSQYVLQQLENWESNELNALMDLSIPERKFWLDQAGALKALERNAKNLLQIDEHHSFDKLINKSIEALPTLLRFRKLLSELPSNLYRVMGLTTDLEGLEAVILKSNWIRFSGMFPELASLDGDRLAQKLEEVIQLQREEANQVVGGILSGRVKQFRKYHTLLQTPSAKLKTDEKELKAKLKAGKSILVKEFSKSRQYKSVRELLASDASLWIELLCPLYLCTPLQVSRHFELKENLFQLVLFDEASQMILPKALAALHRGRRMLVAGDSQQMSPPQFFSGNTGAVDLLHQASYYLPPVHLKHHYRSRSHELIAFSNRHFYHDSLLVFPEAGLQSGKMNWCFVENGVYENRQNIQEAKAVSKAIESALKKDISIGIVAFSEQQLGCIWQQLPELDKSNLTERISSGKAFMKALEQVQGEECELLIISFGYGKDPGGQFHLRFGPLSQKNGPRRLNVLLTRAISQIEFFTSVKASDFSMTSNEAVNLLRLLLHDLEHHKFEQAKHLPFDLHADADQKRIRVENVHERFPDVHELLTFHRVMTKRNWKIIYQP